MLPSPTDLSYFVTIADSGSFTKAAGRLGVAQPSLTLAVRRLEACLGTRLFVRSRQGVTLTKAGESLLQDTQDLLQRWENLRTGALSATNEVRGRLRLGIHPSVAIYALPPFLPALLNKHPDLEVVLIHDLSRNITREVVELKADIGIVVNPSPHPDLVIRPLAQDRVTLWQLPSLKNKDVLLCEPSLLQTQTILRKLHRQGHRFKRVMECANLEVITRLAQCGTGAAILPERVAGAQNRKLVAVAGAPQFHDEIALIYRTEQRELKTLKAFAEAVQTALRS